MHANTSIQVDQFLCGPLPENPKKNTGKERQAIEKRPDMSLWAKAKNLRDQAIEKAYFRFFALAHNDIREKLFQSRKAS